MIGDVLTSSILFEALRKQFPKAELHYLINTHTYPVVQNNPDIDRFILYSKEHSFGKLAKEIKAENYNVVIDVLSNIKTAILTGVSGAKIRISYDKVYTRPVSTDVFSRNMEAKTIAGSAIEKRLRLLSAISNDFPAEIKPKIYLKENEILEAKNTLKASKIDFDKTLFMIGALGSNEKKTYPLPFFAKVLDHIVKETQANLLLNYIPNQKVQVKKLFDFCNAATQKNIFLNIYGNSLREFLALTYHCDALIGNEGGAINMAKALEVPTFSIFSPSLNKDNWNIYEDGIKNVSVHLKDFQPHFFNSSQYKFTEQKNVALYQKLNPELFKLKLNEFFKNLEI